MQFYTYVVCVYVHIYIYPISPEFFYKIHRFKLYKTINYDFTFKLTSFDIFMTFADLKKLLN